MNGAKVCKFASLQEPYIYVTEFNCIFILFIYLITALSYSPADDKDEIVNCVVSWSLSSDDIFNVLALSMFCTLCIVSKRL